MKELAPASTTISDIYVDKQWTTGSGTVKKNGLNFRYFYMSKGTVFFHLNKSECSNVRFAVRQDCFPGEGIGSNFNQFKRILHKLSKQVVQIIVNRQIYDLI